MSVLRDQIKKEFKPTNVGIVEFSESEEYCGKPLYPYQRVLLKLIFLEEMEGWEEDVLTHWTKGGRNGEITLSPNIRERRDWCRAEGYEHFSQIDLVGGRRSAKGHITGLAATKKLWSVRNIVDPGRHFNMDLDKQIEFSCIAASLGQAKTRQFADFYSSITRCKALEPHISRQQEEMITLRCDSDDENLKRMKAAGMKVGRDFAKLRVIPLAANADTLRGSASILTVFDEMAFMMPGESRSSAQECYTALEPSLAQFGQHAMVFCNSSPYTKIGQFYELWEHAMRPAGHADGFFPMRFAIQYPSWAIYDEWWRDPDRRWKNAIMVSPDWPDQLDPDVPESKLDKDSITKREAEKLKEKANPDTYKVEYRGKWAVVLDAYLNPAKVEAAYSGFKPDGSPCMNTLSMGGTYLHTYMGHCDPSSTTAGFGFAMGHIEEFPDPTGIFPDGVARHVVFDIVKRWNPEDYGGVINYIKVREELEHYVDIYRPVALTFDQYNSTGMMQELREHTRKMGIQNCRISEVTATQKVNWNRWEAFKTALYLGLVHIPPDCIDLFTDFNHSEYSALELTFLQEVQTGQTKRVDKQELGPIQTKDIADCIAEVTVKFLGSYIGDLLEKRYNDSKMQSGSEGGYQIGGRQPGGPMGGSGSRFEEFYGGRAPSSHPSKARGINPRRRRR